MLNWLPNGADPAGTGTPTDLVIPSNQAVVATLFCPTGRNMDNNSTDEPSSRQKSLTYARGYKEVTTYRTSGGSPYRHRRIVFSLKGGPALFLLGDTSFATQYYTLFTSIGQVRQNATLPTNLQNVLTSIVFRGGVNIDWFSVFNAKVDTSRVTIHSDKTVIINPGNATGSHRLKKMWYPLNKNLMYGDDEQGPNINSTPFSTQGRIGMGDLYLLDFYQSTVSEGGAAAMGVNHEGTYYWHEK